MARTQSADYEVRREAMLDKAAALFSSKGFHGAAMTDLAVACEVSKSLLYHYFPSKEDVLYEVMTSHLDELVEDVKTVLSEDGRVEEKISHLVHAFMNHYVGAADRHKVLLNELKNLPPDRQSAIVAKQRSIINSVQSLLSGLRGSPKDTAKLRAFTMLMFGMINWTHTWFNPGGAVSSDELADMVVDLMLSKSSKEKRA